MEKALSHPKKQGAIGAIFGLVLAVLMAGLALVPAQWLVATLILVVLTMPFALITEPAISHLRGRKALLAP